MFGSRNPVNEQIVLYVLSRVVTSLLPREPEAIRAAAAAPPPKPLPAGALTPPGYPYPKPLPPSSKVFEVYAALTWGAVMWLFQHRRDRLQSGMVNSMQYLYLVRRPRWITADRGRTRRSGATGRTSSGTTSDETGRLYTGVVASTESRSQLGRAIAKVGLERLADALQAV